MWDEFFKRLLDRWRESKAPPRPVRWPAEPLAAPVRVAPPRPPAPAPAPKPGPIPPPVFAALREPANPVSTADMLPVPGGSFRVSDVAAPISRLSTMSMKTAVERTVGGPVESCSHYTGLGWGATGNVLIHAARLAFDSHFPLVLSPDMLWLTILQGVAIHVRQHAETLRSRLVRHEGKLLIDVRFDDFIKGSLENPWERAFSALNQSVREYLVDGIHDTLMPRFSTTGPIEQAAYDVALLDVMQSFFNYQVSTMCGIPYVTLEGEVADWQRLERAVDDLTMVLPDLDWWIEDLREIVPQFVQASQGTVDRVFWKSLYNLNNGSGGPHLSGWLAHFMPYVIKGQTFQRNPLVQSTPGWLDDHSGLQPDELPRSLSAAPFQWQYHETTYPMQLLSGLLAVEQDPETFAIRPRIGWAVRDRTASAN